MITESLDNVARGCDACCSMGAERLPRRDERGFGEARFDGSRSSHPRWQQPQYTGCDTHDTLWWIFHLAAQVPHEHDTQAGYPKRYASPLYEKPFYPPCVHPHFFSTLIRFLPLIGLVDSNMILEVNSNSRVLKAVAFSLKK